VLVEQVVAHFGADLTGRRFAVWGLSFKPETDDMREAPSLTVVRALCARGAEVVAHDPEAGHEAERHFADLIAAGVFTLAEKNYDALPGADALLILTEWQPYRRPNFERMRELLKSPVIFDGRNLYTPDMMRTQGFHYRSIGRSDAQSGLRVESHIAASGD
jgi:UDPglucose 6-dehydrogenase